MVESLFLLLGTYSRTMPRKVNYGLDYDDDYNYYEDYDDGYYDDWENDKAQPAAHQEITRPGLWRCSVCTYDNDESMSTCDICGVIRDPSNSSSYNDKNLVDGICKDSGASIMAKSLFSLLPRRTPKKAIIYQQEGDFVKEEDNNICKLGNIHGDFLELHKAFSSRSQNDLDIVPLKFDVPSPDDLVCNGLQSSKLASKENSVKLASSKVPVNISGKNAAVETPSNARSTNSLAASRPEGRSDDMAEFLANGGKSQSLTSNFNNISTNTKSESSKKVSVNVGRGTSHAQYKAEKWMVPDQGEGSLTQLNLAIVGHVDSGKSTLSGRLLHLLGRISQKEMHKYEKEAKVQGKSSFAFAWALDESAEERERGITMTVAVAYLDSRKHHVVLLDSPGHRDFVPNMISGATQADAAILVVDASLGSFEAGMDTTGGQTREHAQLIRSFGVDQIIVAVNKMDAVQYSKERFDMINVQLGSFLRSCGFKDSSVSWVPLSAMENQNLVAAASDSRLSSWYRGPYLLDAIDSLQPPTRDFSKPLLIPICDVIKSPSLGQVSACGKLEAGALRSGLKVLVMPSGDVATVRSIECQSETCAIARAGDNVAVSLQGIDSSRVIAGCVLCHPDFPVAVSKHLELKVLVLDFAMPILIGSQLEFHIHHAKEAARVVKIVSLLDPKTGKEAKKAPRCVTAKQRAVIEVILDGPVCVEEFSNSRALGRVFLRASGRTVAVGIVTRIVEEPE